jgi:signal transduction histidine kinase
VKELTLLHGGSVGAHSEGPGKGSTFTLRLPLAEARAEA